MQTRVFQSGNSIAVRIPKELAIVEAAQDVEIERVGETLVIRPLKRRKLTGIGKLVGSFSTDFMAQGRETHEQTERDWDAVSALVAKPAVKAAKTKTIASKGASKRRG